jgi:hypothetical protein
MDPLLLASTIVSARISSSARPGALPGGSGIVLVVLATGLFVTMNSAVKYLGAHLPTVELIWARVVITWWEAFGRPPV